MAYRLGHDYDGYRGRDYESNRDSTAELIAEREADEF